jgi:hypothetical protein
MIRNSKNERCSVGDTLRVIGVLVGRELLLDAPQLFLGVSAISDGGAIGQHVDGDEEGVAEACRTSTSPSSVISIVRARATAFTSGVSRTVSATVVAP